MVDPSRLLDLVREIPAEAWSRYPHLTRAAVESAVAGFVADSGASR